MKKRLEKIRAAQARKAKSPPPTTSSTSSRTGLASPVVGLEEHNSSILSHVPRKQAISSKQHVWYRQSSYRDSVDADADLAMIQRRSEIFSTALKLSNEVQGFCDDYTLFRLSGITSKPLPRAHRRASKTKPTKKPPRWLLSAEVLAEKDAKRPAVVISNGEDALGTDFFHGSGSRFNGFLPDADKGISIGDAGLFEGRAKPKPGDLLCLPNEVLEVVAGHLDSISHLNSLSSTCRTLHFMLETWNLGEWLPTSMRDPICGPFPHAVVACRARDLADWVIHGKNEIVPGLGRCMPRGCDMAEGMRRELFSNCVTHGYVGIMELAALKIGVRLRDLRLFQMRKKELRPLFDFVIQRKDHNTLFNLPGLPRSMIDGICREIAVVNKYIYCELFHHDVDNLSLKYQQQLPNLGAETRQDWLYYCVPDTNVPNPLPCQNMYFGCDRLMLMNFLGDMAMAWWNDEMEMAWESRTDAMIKQGGGGAVPLHAHWSEAAAQALHVIATNTIDIAFPPVGGLELYRAKEQGVDVIACKHEKLDRKIGAILSFSESETRIWNPFLGMDRVYIDMADFKGLEHDIWLSMQKI